MSMNGVRVRVDARVRWRTIGAFAAATAAVTGLHLNPAIAQAEPMPNPPALSQQVP